MADGFAIPDGWKLVNLGTMCPEQYELHDVHGNTVAYFRLRWGCFRAHVPDAGGDVVYEHVWDGDEFKGTFDSPDEAREQLRKAIEAVSRA